jgi:hypothetical protein
MKTTLLRLIAGMAAGMALGLFGLAPLAGHPSLAAWTDTHCNGGSRALDGLNRRIAYAYAQPAKNEGYEWGGGCYRLNDVDDTPGLPTDGGGEGADCSGFVFKTWGLQVDGGAGPRHWDHDKNIHGPYSTASYFAPSASMPFKTIGKAYGTTAYMDAFAWRDYDQAAGHVALINAEGSGGFDWIIHARNNSDGTLVNYLDYRSQSIYRGVSRKGWMPDCWPKCL